MLNKLTCLLIFKCFLLQPKVYIILFYICLELLLLKYFLHKTAEIKCNATEKIGERKLDTFKIRITNIRAFANNTLFSKINSFPILLRASYEFMTIHLSWYEKYMTWSTLTGHTFYLKIESSIYINYDYSLSAELSICNLLKHYAIKNET